MTAAAPPFDSAPADARAVRASRRRLAVDGIGIAASVAAFGIVYGLAARQAGFSPLDAVAMSTLVFAGSAQFAAVGLVAAAAPWPAIVLVTLLLDARHLLYAAAMAPYLGRLSRLERAGFAYLLTDEGFALGITHFRRLGRADVPGYVLGALLCWVPWNVATLVGVLGGQAIPDTRALGLDVVFPAAMAGLAVGLVHGRRDVVAAAAGVAIGVGVALATQASVGILAGGLLGPVVALLLPGGEAPRPVPASRGMGSAP